jgi:hypothetical protein
MDGAQPGSSRTKLQIVAPIPESSPTRQDMAGAVLGTADPTAGQSVHFQGRRGTGTDTELAELANVTMYTPDEELELLFDPKLVPSGLQKDVGPEYHVGPVRAVNPPRY